VELELPPFSSAFLEGTGMDRLEAYLLLTLAMSIVLISLAAPDWLSPLLGSSSFQSRPNSSGILATFTAMRRASSKVSTFAMSASARVSRA
jgi:hypothetical protein